MDSRIYLLQVNLLNSGYPPLLLPRQRFILHLAFSNRTYDLDTAFAIMCSANYLQVQPLYVEIQARIVVEMMHGLFYAFLEFTEYERITGGKWGNSCRCRQFARRASRVLQFSVHPDMQNVYFDRGTRRALVGYLDRDGLRVNMQSCLRRRVMGFYRV